MQSQLNPYLSFRDAARPAMEFYQGIFGGTLESSTFLQKGRSAFGTYADCPISVSRSCVRLLKG